MAGDTEVQQRHTTSLAVWDVPAAVATGETFTVKAGVKSSAGVALGGACVELCDGAGAVVAQGLLEDEPWPDSEALCWTEIALKAPAEPGTLSLTPRGSTAMPTSRMSRPLPGSASTSWRAPSIR